MARWLGRRSLELRAHRNRSPLGGGRARGRTDCRVRATGPPAFRSLACHASATGCPLGRCTAASKAVDRRNPQAAAPLVSDAEAFGRSPYRFEIAFRRARHVGGGKGRRDRRAHARWPASAPPAKTKEHSSPPISRHSPPSATRWPSSRRHSPANSRSWRLLAPWWHKSKPR